MKSAVIQCSLDLKNVTSLSGLVIPLCLGALFLFNTF